MRYIFIALCLVLVLLGLASCSTTREGLTREQAIYKVGTNTVAYVQHDIVPYVPAPWNGVLAGLGTAAAGALAWWNHRQQKSLDRLNGLQKNSAK